MSKKESLSETAARWFIRLQHLPSEAPEHSQFEAWLAASPAHQAEYASISELWQQLDSPEDLRDINARMQQKAFLDKATRKKRLKNILASTGACITIGLAALLGLQQYQVWQAQPVLQMASHNPVGQISTQTLEDGSKVTLSAQSDIQVTFYRHQRHIKLNRGEAILK
jgi:transmembrane sensor